MLVVPQNDLNSVKWLAVFCDEVQVIKVIDYLVYMYVCTLSHTSIMYICTLYIHVYTDLE